MRNRMRLPFSGVKQRWFVFFQFFAELALLAFELRKSFFVETPFKRDPLEAPFDGPAFYHWARHGCRSQRNRYEHHRTSTTALDTTSPNNYMRTHRHHRPLSDVWPWEPW